MGFLVKLAKSCALKKNKNACVFILFLKQDYTSVGFWSFDGFAKYQLIIQDELHQKLSLSCLNWIQVH